VKAGIARIPERAWQNPPGLSRGWRGADRGDRAGRASADRSPHPLGRPPNRAMARLAALRVHHQPHRTTRAS
jgi:hypothetical protein